jgi:SanA protein
MAIKKRKSLIFKRILFILLAILLAGGAAVFLIDTHVKSKASEFILTDVNALPQVDAVIVLGAYVLPGGYPSTILRDRLDTGLEVFTAGKTNRIVVTGDHGTTDYDEVNGMRQYLESKGVSREMIFMDHAGFNTYDSMYRARDVFMIKKAVIVTQEYHLYRALYIARSLGIEAWGYPSDLRYYAGQSYYDLREIAARVKDYFQVNLFHTKPRFLGEPLPVWENGEITDDGKS